MMKCRIFKFFGKILFFSLLIFLHTFPASGNNIRVTGKPIVVGFVGSDTAIVELNLSWDNSWRDDFNWDAAWIFLKYKKRGAVQAWHHGYLLREGHEATPQGDNQGGGYTFMFGEAGSGANAKVTGVYLMRDLISEGRVNARLRLKWLINANPQNRLTISDFGSDYKSVYVAVHAIEMAYVPYNSYYLGDGISNQCFHEAYGTERNPIRLNNYKSLSASSIYQNKYPPEYAVDNNMNSHYHSAGNSNEWFMIDFGSKKEMRYFTIRTHYAGTGYFLEGSNDGENWSTLWSGSGSDWSQTQSKHRITSPGAYQYYRFRETGNYLVIYDVALWKEEVPPLRIDSEELLYYSVARNNLAEKLQLPVAYPKGYAGFYVMKYETSQEQYVEFLNSLTLAQQKTHVDNNSFEQMKRGEYVFGDRDRPNCRNGIVFIEQKRNGGPAVFGNNLNPANDFFALDDGQTLACNYLSPYDMLAFCDWSGLRPMSELEYEKACRRPYPQLPERGEYVWNTNSGVNSLNGLGDLAFLGDERETANNIAKNVNGGTNNRMLGPVRCGLFTTSGTNQVQSGATYWGVMEMSGNLWEMCYNVTANGAKFIANNLDYSHGNGELNDAGATDIAVNYWPAVVGAIGVRGGGFKSVDSLLRISDRSFATGNYFTAMTQRDSTVGFRGVRGMLNSTGFNGGTITCPNGTSIDTTCVGAEVVLTGNLPSNSIGKVSYVWYVSEDNGASWKLIEGQTNKNLKYSDFVNPNTTATYKLYKFKRKATCAVGEAEAEASLYVMPLPWTINYEEFANVGSGTIVQVTNLFGTNFHGDWSLSRAPGILSVSDYGAISGIVSDLIINFQVKVIPDKCPDVSYEKEVALTRIFSYTGTEQNITLAPGKYKMECWGARGGYSRCNGSLNRASGSGGYTKGDIQLTTTQTLFAYVGGQGADAVVKRNSAGGYNGGGLGTWDNKDDESSGGGGGASDIRLTGGGVWNDFESLKSRIMVAGGGGGRSWSLAVGSAGGLTGVGGNGLAYAGTQTSGYAFGIGQDASGVANSDGVGGGGGGYYGGLMRNASNASSGCGGSSFISGHNGCDAISASSVSGSIIHTGQPNHYSGLVFSNTVMVDGQGYEWTTVQGAQTGMPNCTMTGIMYGNAANGQVKITPLP